MDTEAAIDRAMSAGRKALTEHESKMLLAQFGIPVTPEIMVANVDGIHAAAQKIGYPVALKGVGENLLHKTEKNLVHLDLAGPEFTAKAAALIRHNAGASLEGFLVQPMVRGKRELVAGMFRDPVFGPVVMVGVGGVFTEALGDISFGIAPFSRQDALDMITGIRSARLLGAFRGEKEVDLEKLVDILMALSRIGMDCPQVSEIDINPLITSPEGDLTAVDALVLLQPPPTEPSFTKPVSPDRIGQLFYPQSIAFIGATAQIGKWGHILFTITASGGFSGDIHLVNPKGKDIANRKVYRNVADIPGEVDLAVVTIPAALVEGLIPQLKKKSIKNMLLISSGFAETGPEGRRLEKEFIRKAEAAGILVLGPNTMGICNPHINLYCTGSHVTPRPGSTVVVAQSGNMGTQLLAFAEQQGIGIRGFCGSGNEAMMTIEDFLDAFKSDDLTKTVMLYVESVKNGRRFLRSATSVSRKKPIVLLKGGQSAEGNRAAASHTGAMASDAKVFDAACRQSGIIKVEHSMELLDLAAAFSSLPLPKGGRAAIMTLGGGWGVVTADLCSRYRLEVPELPDHLLQRFDQILPAYWSRSNPVDIVGENDPELPNIIIKELLAWDGCDAVINLGIVGRRILVSRLAGSVRQADPNYTPDFLDAIDQTVVEFEKAYIANIVALMACYQKPVYGVSLMTDRHSLTVNRVPGAEYKGIFYQTPERAVKAFARMVQYRRFLEREKRI